MRIFFPLIISMLFLFSCSSTAEETNEEKVKVTVEQLDAEAFRNAVSKEREDIIIIDVRTPTEYAEGAIPNAINIDFLNSNFVSQVKTLDKDKEVYLYCAAGGRSSKAARMMGDLGFQKILELKGGLSSYE